MGWQFPVKAPRMTTEEFKKAKAEYVARYGYTIYVPGFSDIIHIGTEKPITPEEERLWKKKDYEALGPERTEEIRRMKQKRKERFLAMMSSPTPNVVRNVGSIMTALDDIEDAMTVLSVVGRVAARIAPRVIGRFLTGPVGWIMTAADIIALLNLMSHMPIGGKSNKRIGESCADKNPFSKKAKAKRARKLRRLAPSKGELLEIMQTTDNMFGIGISLGPIVGLIQDIAFGTAYTAMGKPVSVKLPIPDFKFTGQVALQALKSLATTVFTGQELTPSEHRNIIIAGNLATQTAWSILQEWNPLDMVENINDVYIAAPRPTNPLTLEIFEEEGLNVDDYIGWPGVGRKSATLTEIMETTQPAAMDSFTAYAFSNRYNWDGFIAGCNANELAENMIALIEGDDQVEIDYIVAEKVYFKLSYAGWRLPSDITEKQLDCMTRVCELLEHSNIDPTLKEILDIFPYYCGFKFTRKIPSKPIGEAAKYYPEWPEGIVT